MQPLLRVLKASVPIIGAPMWTATGAELASSVARSGGFGFIAAGFFKDGALLQRCSSCDWTLSFKNRRPCSARSTAAVCNIDGCSLMSVGHKTTSCVCWQGVPEGCTAEWGFQGAAWSGVGELHRRLAA